MISLHRSFLFLEDLNIAWKIRPPPQSILNSAFPLYCVSDLRGKKAAYVNDLSLCFCLIPPLSLQIQTRYHISSFAALGSGW